MFSGKREGDRSGCGLDIKWVNNYYLWVGPSGLCVGGAWDLKLALAHSLWAVEALVRDGILWGMPYVYYTEC